MLPFTVNKDAYIKFSTRLTPSRLPPADHHDHVTPALKQLHWLPIKSRIVYKLCLLMHNIHTGRAPQYLV